MGTNEKARSPYTVEIRLDESGVLSVRVLGDDWQQSTSVHELLQKISPLINELDKVVKEFGNRRPAPVSEVIQ